MTLSLTLVAEPGNPVCVQLVSPTRTIHIDNAPNRTTGVCEGLLCKPRMISSTCRFLLSTMRTFAWALLWTHHEKQGFFATTGVIPVRTSFGVGPRYCHGRLSSPAR